MYIFNFELFLQFPADYIPEPPNVPDPIEAAVPVDVNVGDIVQAAAGEPSFAELGLGGWGPVGIVQNLLEWLHLSTGLPWWGTIAVGNFMFYSFQLLKYFFLV